MGPGSFVPLEIPLSKVPAANAAAPTLSTAEAAVETLLAAGIDKVFALPGVHNDPLFDAFHAAQGRLKVLHARHEQTAAYMALGAALATARPQAFSVVPGPGFLNASAAVLTAQTLNAPVLALSGQIPQRDIDRGHGHLHELRDQIGLARHFTKSAERIRAPHEAPRLINEALATTMRGRRGPTYLECAMDVWGRRSPVELAAPFAAEPPGPVDPEAIERAAKVLGGAKRPIIVVGAGALDAGPEITALAEMLEAPVVAYRRGQGVVSARHRLAVNLPVGHRLWREADAVIGIGTKLLIQQSQWGVDKDLKVVRIDIDPEETERWAKPDVGIVGDARLAVAALLDRLPAHNSKRESRADEILGHRRWLAERLSRLEPQMSYLRAMRRALPEEGVLVDEVTQLGFAARLAFPVYRPRSYFSPGSQDNLGWGYGTALGVKAALPDTPVLATAGDGGFLYQMGELATAAQHNLAVVVVVFDNGQFGNVKLLQKENFGGRHIAADLVNPDFGAVAEAFGVEAYRAADADGLERSLNAAFATNRPALVHVRCGEMPSPWDMILMPRVRG
jgi:acetolactate synthase I/II/III large subunit